MIKTIVPFLLLLSFSALGQNKIEGIGKFKLKKTTTALLDTLAKEQDFDRITIKSFEEYFGLRYKKNKIAEVFSDTVKSYNSPPYSHLCKNVRVFYLPKIKISDIDISEMYLTFYDDTLIDIHVDYNKDVVEALELKYGAPVLDTKEKEVSCTVNLTGATVKYTETMYYQKWENGNIKCTAAIGDYRDSKCEKQVLAYITISIEKFSEKIRDCDESEKDRIKNKENTEKKKKLDDF